MSPYSAFLSSVLRLQIRDRNLCGCGAFGARAFVTARERRSLFAVLALRRLEIPARDFERRQRGNDTPRADRKHPAVVRTPAPRIGSAVTVRTQGAAVSSPPFQ